MRALSSAMSRRTFIGVGCAGLAAAARVSWSETPREHPNIVIIVMDTARQDHLSCYGYQRATTPFLEELASEARVFRNAYSTSSWTVPAHASLFTGLHSISHATTWEHFPLDARLTTLAQVLRDHGYRTIGISENKAVSNRRGFDKGFDRFTNPAHLPEATETFAIKEFADIFAETDDRPVFAFVNLFGPHDPYNSSAQFFGTFLSDPKYKGGYGCDLLDVLIKGTPLDEKRLLHLTEHYDAELLYADYVVMKMAEALRERNEWDNTVFIILSDHGENLGDHGFVKHQFNLYEPLVRVPLLIRFPDIFPAGSVEEHMVQLTDVFPTVLELAGIDPAAYPNQGRSLLPGKTDPDRVILTELYRHAWFQQMKEKDERWLHPRVLIHNRRLKSIRVGALKLILGSDGWCEMFDLSHDAGEMQDLSSIPTCAEAKESLAKRLEAHLNELRTAQPPPNVESGQMDEETEQTLRSLGYL